MDKFKYIIHATCLCILCVSTPLSAQSNAAPSVRIQKDKGETSLVFGGTVLDSQTAEPLVGATIRVKDQKTLGTASDLDGNFSIRVPGRKQSVTLVISYVGYEPVEIKLDKQTGNIIKLTEKTNELQEFAVVAYGTQKKVTVTGAMSSIDGESLKKSPSGSLGNALAGAVSGISTVQYSGQPGAEDPNIYVRGTGSLSESASKPLILVDGGTFFLPDGSQRSGKHHRT